MVRIDTNHSTFIYLQHEVKQAKNLLYQLKPKTKRSLDFIDSAWKWLAGSPDHDDVVTLREKTNNVLSNNNQQVVINNLFENKINNITRIINQVNNE